MDGIIRVAAAVLILAYVGFAVWFICRRRTVAGCIGASVCFLGGGLIVIPVAEAVAAFICWAVIIIIVLAIIGAACSGGGGA
jgi:hypothetical protein